MYLMLPNLQPIKQSSRNSINPISRLPEAIKKKKKEVTTKDIQYLLFLTENR